MGIKMIAMDIDGTIIDIPREYTVNKTVRQAIEKAKEAGIVLCFATGRIYSAVRSVEAETGIHGICICNNGSVIMNDNQVCFEKNLKRETLIYCREFAREFMVNATFFVGDSLYRIDFCDEQNEMNNDFGEVKADNMYLIQNEQEFNSLIQKNVSKVVFSAADDQIDKAVLEWKRRESVIPEEVEMTKSFHNVLGITCKHVNKGTALAYVANVLGIDAQEIMAIGDNENDVPMLKYAGTGVAVGNAIPAAKEAADVIVPDAGHSGAAYAILHYALKV